MGLISDLFKKLLSSDKNLTLKLRYDPKKQEVNAETINNVTNTTTTNIVYNITLNPTKEGEINKDELLKEIKETLALLPEHNRVLKQDTNDLLSKLYKYEINKKADDELIAFFSGLIPPQDLQTLEASLFVRNQFVKSRKQKNSKEYIKQLKKQIAIRFLDRGRFICNLATAGYYEAFFRPLYEESHEAFPQKYEDFIGSYQFAIFINELMGIEEAFYKMKKRVYQCKKYGIKKMYIHAIGKHNVGLLTALIKNRSVAFFKDRNIKWKWHTIRVGIVVVELLI